MERLFRQQPRRIPLPSSTLALDCRHCLRPLSSLASLEAQSVDPPATSSSRDRRTEPTIATESTETGTVIDQAGPAVTTLTIFGVSKPGAPAYDPSDCGMWDPVKVDEIMQALKDGAASVKCNGWTVQLGSGSDELIVYCPDVKTGKTAEKTVVTEKNYVQVVSRVYSAFLHDAQQELSKPSFGRRLIERTTLTSHPSFFKHYQRWEKGRTVEQIASLNSVKTQRKTVAESQALVPSRMAILPPSMPVYNVAPNVMPFPMNFSSQVINKNNVTSQVTKNIEIHHHYAAPTPATGSQELVEAMKKGFSEVKEVMKEGFEDVKALQQSVTLAQQRDEIIKLLVNRDLFGNAGLMQILAARGFKANSQKKDELGNLIADRIIPLGISATMMKAALGAQVGSTQAANALLIIKMIDEQTKDVVAEGN